MTNNKTIAMVLVGFCCMTGCADGKTTYRTAYQVVIDPEFTMEEAVNIIKAEEMWEEATSEIFATTIGTCENPSYDQICFKKSLNTDFDPAIGLTSTLDGDAFVSGNADTIFIFPPMSNASDDFYVALVAHELGHCLGLSHTPMTTCALMNADVSCTMTVNQVDVEQWQSVPRN